MKKRTLKEDATKPKIDTHLAMQRRLANRALSGSTYRTLPVGSKGIFVCHLENIKIPALNAIRDQKQLDTFIYQESTRLYKKLCSGPNTKNIGHSDKKLGTPWGYPAKAINIFLWDICLNRVLVSSVLFDKLRPLLHCPLDSKVLRELRRQGRGVEAMPIREITLRKYKALQQETHLAAKKLDLYRIEFDDYAFTK